jgi:hypothetical protein
MENWDLKKKKKRKFFLVFGSVENTEKALGFLGFCREGQLAKRERTQMWDKDRKRKVLHFYFYFF